MPKTDRIREELELLVRYVGRSVLSSQGNIDCTLASIQSIIKEEWVMGEEEIRQIIVQHIGVEDKVYPLGRIAKIDSQDKKGNVTGVTTLYINTSELAHALSNKIPKPVAGKKPIDFTKIKNGDEVWYRGIWKDGVYIETKMNPYESVVAHFPKDNPKPVAEPQPEQPKKVLPSFPTNFTMLKEIQQISILKDFVKAIIEYLGEK